MKIMHVGQLIGGLDIYIRNTTLYAGNDFEFILVHGEKDGNKPIIKQGKPLKEYAVCLYRQINLWKDLKGLIQVIRIIRKEKPDAIHCHSAKGGVIGRVAGWITQTKTFYTPHAFSFLSTSSRVKRYIYILLERSVKFDSYLLACSDSERELGIQIVHYKPSQALVWNNAVPDASNYVK